RRNQCTRSFVPKESFVRAARRRDETAKRNPDGAVDLHNEPESRRGDESGAFSPGAVLQDQRRLSSTACTSGTKRRHSAIERLFSCETLYSTRPDAFAVECEGA